MLDLTRIFLKLKNEEARDGEHISVGRAEVQPLPRTVGTSCYNNCALLARIDP